ncbi:MAG: type II secretion system protein [Planctomycetes bacterium]|nr:type II secretion system protein [Planctomycetota bacterium]
MKKKSKSGFTLIEMIIVLAIISITSVVAIPGMISVLNRNKLIEMVNVFQQAAAKTRGLAMQTKRAAVLEVRADGMWINLMTGANCSTNLLQRCLTNSVEGGDGLINLTETSFVEAGAAMCGGVALAFEVGAGGVRECRSLDLPTDAFALCYSGRGELFVRPEADPNMECDSTDPAQTGDLDKWQQACGIRAGENVGENLDISDGAVIIFNRYVDGNCQAASIGVRRAVFFPTSGLPYSKLASASPGN